MNNRTPPMDISAWLHIHAVMTRKVLASTYALTYAVLRALYQQLPHY